MNSHISELFYFFFANCSCACLVGFGNKKVDNSPFASCV